MAVETVSQTSSEDSVSEKQDKGSLVPDEAAPSLSPSEEKELLALAKDVSSAPSAASTAVKGQDLSAYTGGLSDSSLANKEITLQEAVDELLKWAAVSDSQLGSSAEDRANLAKSLGMIEKEADLTANVQGANLQSMYSVAKRLHEAYRSEKKEPLFLNGRSQPIFPYSSGEDRYEEYTYEGSEIVRFPVYVETDHDTDGDGKRDLVKAIVQLPKAGAKGDYKAATILEARP